MQVILHVALDEINPELIVLLKTLLSSHAEVVIRKEVVKLEEYDRGVSLEQAMQEFSQLDYSPEFLDDLAQGLKTSSIYAKQNQAT
jgi:hypothetical protein